MLTYESTAEALVARIKGLIPKHPEILAMKDPWDLYKIKEFKCDDLQPSLFQAGWALSQAIIRFNEEVEA